jgi:hypothetical protein
MIDMSRTGGPCIKDHPKVTGGIEPLEWLPEELNWSGFRDAFSGIFKSMAELFEILVATLHFFSHRSRSLRYVSWYLTSRAG